MSDAPMVERRARIFRFGYYPDKRWGITRDEFIAANGMTGTIPIGLDPIGRAHYLGERSVLDGRTGEASFSVEGEEVWATLRAPSLVMEAAIEHGLKVSGVFHPTDKTISKIDLVQDARIPDAIIFAGEHGEVLVFEDDEPEAVEFCDGEGGDSHHAHQVMHDLASHGRPRLCSGAVGFAATPKETDDDRAFRQIHHYAVHMGAYCPGMPDGINGHEEVGMSGENEEVVEVESPEEDAVTFSDEDVAAMTPTERALYRRMKALEARDEARQKKSIGDEAVAFARDLIDADAPRAMPFERALIVEGYERAARFDALHPEAVTFSAAPGDTRTGTNVDAFRAAYLARPRLSIRDRKVSGKVTQVAFTALDMEPENPAAAEDAELRRIDESTRKFAAGLNGRK